MSVIQIKIIISIKTTCSQRFDQNKIAPYQKPLIYIKKTKHQLLLLLLFTDCYSSKISKITSLLHTSETSFVSGLQRNRKLKKYIYIVFLHFFFFSTLTKFTIHLILNSSHSSHSCSRCSLISCIHGSAHLLINSSPIHCLLRCFSSRLQIFKLKFHPFLFTFVNSSQLRFSNLPEPLYKPVHS